MTLHQKRRKLIIRRPVIAILRRVIKAVCGESVARRKLNRFWCLKVARIQIQIVRRAERLKLSASQIEPHDRWGRGG